MSGYTALAARVPTEVVADTRALIDRIREADDPLPLRREGAEAVVKLTQIGLESFFLEPVRQLGLGSVASSMVKLGIGSAGAAIAVFVRRLVAGLSAEQLREIAEIVDARLLDLEMEGEEE